ncbi:MAG: hypothetical protein U9P12_01410 [Verrucomicrobiota bacterium]|nr:hypothetical protein [Verrucomicrobiota bacterium]
MTKLFDTTHTLTELIVYTAILAVSLLLINMVNKKKSEKELFTFLGYNILILTALFTAWHSIAGFIVYFK